MLAIMKMTEDELSIIEKQMEKDDEENCLRIRFVVS
jgi:hypothetical protein